MNSQNLYLNTLIKDQPQARAQIRGSSQYPRLWGEVTFYSVPEGVLIFSRVSGLPDSTDTCQSNVYGYHIHEGNACTGTEKKPFANAKGHYNPDHCPHPAHAGDMPPLFGNHGFAWSVFLTDRFLIPDIIGKTIIIHEHADDFVSQPSGNAGPMIGCGEIKGY